MPGGKPRRDIIGNPLATSAPARLMSSRHICAHPVRRQRRAVTNEQGQAKSTCGWDARLYWLWILYNAVAFVVVLTAAGVLAWIGGDILHLDLANGGKLGALLVATAGALLLGGVLGFPLLDRRLR